MKHGTKTRAKSCRHCPMRALARDRSIVNDDRPVPLEPAARTSLSLSLSPSVSIRPLTTPTAAVAGMDCTRISLANEQHMDQEVARLVVQEEYWRKCLRSLIHGAITRQYHAGTELWEH